MVHGSVSGVINSVGTSISMKKTIATIGILIMGIVGSTVVLAQAPPGGGPPDPQARMAALAKELALTDAQKPQFQQIVDQERADLMATIKQEREQNTAVQTAHQTHQKIEDAAMAKLKPILTDDQYQKYQGIVAAEAYARHHREAAASAPAPQ
jgi:cobalamin biosynthesis protein CbiD